MPTDRRSSRGHVAAVQAAAVAALPTKAATTSSSNTTNNNDGMAKNSAPTRSAATDSPARATRAQSSLNTSTTGSVTPAKLDRPLSVRRPSSSSSSSSATTAPAHNIKPPRPIKSASTNSPALSTVVVSAVESKDSDDSTPVDIDMDNVISTEPARPSVPSSTSESAAIGSASVQIDVSVVDNLKDVPFPKKGQRLNPQDEADPLLIMCARACAMCQNRALAPKEIALIAIRRFAWQFTGSQPFALISSCLRSHLKRAHALAYPPLFSSYELSSVPPVADIPCLGIESAAKPVVKRGTFWFLSAVTGFPSPFPNRPLSTLTPNRRNAGPATMSTLGSSQSLTSQPSGFASFMPLSNGAPSTRGRSVSVSVAASADTKAAVPVLASSSQLDTVSKRPSNARSTRSHLALGPDASHESIPEEDLEDDAIQEVDSGAELLSTSLPNATNKRKRTTTLPPALSADGIVPILAKPAATSSTPFINKTKAAGNQAGIPHRRAMSSSSAVANPAGLPKPVQGLRKLKLRLSALPEKTALSASLPTDSAPLIIPHAKRQRTQSMSSLTTPASSTTSFPFDNLHLLIQSANGGSIPTVQAGHLAASGTLFPMEMHHYIPSSPGGSSSIHLPQFDPSLFTSRSAPETNIFSPSVSATSAFIGGPFSRRTSPSASASAIARWHPTPRQSNSPSPRLWAGTPSGLDIQEPGRNEQHLSWAERSRRLTMTDSTILAVQLELAHTLGGSAIDDDDEDDDTHTQRDRNDSQPMELDDEHDMHSFRDDVTSLGYDASLDDAHGGILQPDDLDFAFDFSLESGEPPLLNHQEVVHAKLEHADSYSQAVESPEPENDAGSCATLDLQDLSDGMDNIFESLGISAGIVEGETTGSAVDEDASAHHLAYPIDSAHYHLHHHQALLSTGDVLKKALSTTLCPAAARFENTKPSRLLARRMNSSSSLSFARLAHQPNLESMRPNFSRNPSRDVLPTPVPLVELPLLPAQPSHDMLFFYNDIEGEEDADIELEGLSDLSTPLTPPIKAEDDLDDFNQLAVRRRISRSVSSQAVSEGSEDSFDVDAVVPVRGQSALPGASNGAVSQQKEDDVDETPSVSRSLSSSRTTSPRDSFSPQHNMGPNADWALTPPSEDEIVEDDEKTLDRALLVGPESVGMDDLDDAWPGRRNIFEEGNGSSSSGSNTETVKGFNDALFAGVCVFEPILSPAPLPPIDVSSLPSTRCNSLPPVPTITVESSPRLASQDVENNNMAVDNDLDASRYITVDMGPCDETPLSTPSMTVPVYPSSGAQSPAATFFLQQSSSALSSPALPASTQSFLFHPDTPTEPVMSILLTETKILFYSTPVQVAGGQSKPLLRRVDNDAVDAVTLLHAFEGVTKLEEERIQSMASIHALGNSWVAISFARELVAKFGGGESPLEHFLADDILLHWNDKLLRLGTMLRTKNGLPVPTVPQDRKQRLSPASPVPSSRPSPDTKTVAVSGSVAKTATSDRTNTIQATRSTSIKKPKATKSSPVPPVQPKILPAQPDTNAQVDAGIVGSSATEPAAESSFVSTKDGKVSSRRSTRNK